MNCTTTLLTKKHNLQGNTFVSVKMNKGKNPSAAADDMQLNQ